MQKYIINDITYKLVEDVKNGFDYTAVLDRTTDYFNEYDYIVGDWSYGKLRLKGFCDKSNKMYKSINDIKNKDEYLNEMCAFDCKYFILKKIDDER